MTQATKNMLESEFIYEIIADKALKGFFFKDGRVVPKMELTLEDNKAIDSTLVRVCGPQVNAWVRNLNINKLQEKPLGRIDVADIVLGSIIKLELAHKEVVEIIYQGNYEFYVINDSVGNLQPLDMLKALTLSFNKGDTVYFKVFRDGIPFPDENLLFKGYICGVTLVFANIRGHRISVDYDKLATKSLETVFAWKAESQPERFIEDQLTESNQALFIIDLHKDEFRINPQYSKYQYDDIASVLKTICNIRHSGNGLSTIAPGKITLKKNKSKYSFYVTKKMEVSL